MSVSYYLIKCENILFAVNPDIRIDCKDLKFIFSNLKESPLKGRKSLKEFEFGMKKYVFREYWHGGVMRNVFKNKYWEKECRAYKEMIILMKLKENGINVPAPLFAGRDKSFFYTQFISTEFIEGAKDLAETDISENLIITVFENMEKLFDTGLFHPDMNIKNILVKDDDIFFIDFDKAFFFREKLDIKKRYYIYKRLFRSFHKMGKLQFFLEYDFNNMPSYIKKAFEDYLKVSFIRSFLWIFNKK